MSLPPVLLNESPQERVRELKGLDEDTLVVHEVYASVQGEGTHTGLPCAFVRTTGCHLRCRYCDTPHAFHEGTRRAVGDVVQEVLAFGLPLVLVTGGEPLLQKATRPLLTALCERDLTVLLETSGGVTTEGVDPRVRVILDVKTPGSGEEAANVKANFARLCPHDEVKYVLTDEADLAWATQHLARHELADRCTVLFSPAAGELDPARVAEHVVRERLPVRLQLQLHRILWGDRQGV